MKKIIALSSLIVFLFSTSYAHAVDFCPGGQFNPLCQMASNDYTVLPRNIINILLVVAVLLALGFLIVGGIKWIMSGGDKGKLDSARGTVIAAIVGLIITFLSFMIISFVSYLFGLTSGTIYVLPRLNSAPATAKPSCSELCSGRAGGQGEQACMDTNRNAGNCQ